MDYTSLKASVMDWGFSSSAELTGVADDIIDLAELRLSRDLVTSAFETSSSGSMVVGTPTVTKPADLVTVNYLVITVGGARRALERKTYEWLIEYWPTAATTGVPKYWAEHGSVNITVAPTPGDTYGYQIGYRRRLPGLSAGNLTNWLTDQAGDILIAACQVEVARYLRNQEDLGAWEQRYQQLKNDINSESMRQLRDDYRLPYRVEENVVKEA